MRVFNVNEMQFKGNAPISPFPDLTHKKTLLIYSKRLIVSTGILWFYRLIKINGHFNANRRIFIQQSLIMSSISFNIQCGLRPWQQFIDANNVVKQSHFNRTDQVATGFTTSCQSNSCFSQSINQIQLMARFVHTDTLFRKAIKAFHCYHHPTHFSLFTFVLQHQISICPFIIPKKARKKAFIRSVLT